MSSSAGVSDFTEVEFDGLAMGLSVGIDKDASTRSPSSLLSSSEKENPPVSAILAKASRRAPVCASRSMLRQALPGGVFSRDVGLIPLGSTTPPLVAAIGVNNRSPCSVFETGLSAGGFAGLLPATTGSFASVENPVLAISAKARLRSSSCAFNSTLPQAFPADAVLPPLPGGSFLNADPVFPPLPGLPPLNRLEDEGDPSPGEVLPSKFRKKANLSLTLGMAVCSSPSVLLVPL
eukprot:1196247-Prorocentrum_minimum.AAC.2